MDNKVLDINVGDNNVMERGEKRKLDSIPYPNQTIFKSLCDELDNVGIIKKVCAWKPPIIKPQNATPFHDNITSENRNNNTVNDGLLAEQLNQLHSLQTEIRSNEVKEMVKENGNELNLQTCTSECVTEAFNNDCDVENVTLSSAETLPNELMIDDDIGEYDTLEKKSNPGNKNDELNECKEDKVILNSNDNEIEHNYTINNMKDKIYRNLSCENSLNLEMLSADDLEQNTRTDIKNNTNIKHKRTTLNLEKHSSGEDDIYSNEYFINKIEKSRQHINENSDCNEKNIFDRINIEPVSISNPLNSNFPIQQKIDVTFLENSYENNIKEDLATLQKENCHRIKNVNSTSKSKNLNEQTIDDYSFDMSITNSQLVKVDCEITNRIKNGNIHKTNSHWIRKKLEHKQMLRTLIEQIEAINNTITQATKELKSQRPKKHGQTEIP